LISSDWENLLELGLRRGGEARFLSLLLEKTQVSTEASAVGLYRIGESSARRQVGCGAGLPVDVDPATAGAGWIGLTKEYGMLLEPAESAERVSLSMMAAIVSSVHAAGLSDQLKKQRFEVAQRGVELEALYDVGLAIASMLDASLLGDEILLRAVSLLDARRGALFLATGLGFTLAQTLGGDAVSSLPPEKAKALAALGAVAAEDAPEVLPGTEYVLTVPIEVDGVRRGLLVVGDKESRRGVGPFVDADGRTLSLFANQAGIALQNADLHRQALEKKKLESELELAADIQRRLLPAEIPDLEDYEVAGWNRSARHVGGDYYDLIETEGGLTLLLADVSGKGMPAALLVSTLHSAFRLLTAGQPVTGSLMERLNAHIFAASAPNKFITLFAADLRLESGGVSYVSAGHNPAILVDCAGTASFLETRGLPIGMMPSAQYTNADLPLASGDLLCIYSDGMTECENRQAEELGEARLAELVVEHRSKPLSEIIAQLDQATRDFAGDVPQADDQTVLLLRRK